LEQETIIIRLRGSFESDEHRDRYAGILFNFG